MTTSPIVTITDELVAELECRMVSAEQGGGVSAYFSNETVRALLSERAELKRDAERLNMIQQLFISLKVYPANYGTPFTLWEYGYHHPSRMPFALHGETFRQAIDAAMTGEKP